MWIISNGAPKSGSTWLFNILRSMTAYPAPPAEFLDPSWVNPSVHKDKLEAFLREGHHQRSDYLTKNHFNTLSEKTTILSHDQVAVFNITRDLRDVVVSYYYHYCHKQAVEVSFTDYYRDQGRAFARSVLYYHRLWNSGSTRVFVASYERLHSNFDDELRRIGAFLGRSLYGQDIVRIREETTLNSLKRKYNADHFFRKGVVGDWKEHFTPAVLDDIQDLQKDGQDQ